MRRPALLVLFLLSGALPGRAQDLAYREELILRSRRLGLAQKRPWLRLLHFRGGRSEADGSGFFLSPKGRHDAAEELEADLSGFFAPAAQGARAHPQCRFPARYAWLKERLGFDARLPLQPCPDFEAWKGAIGAEGVSIVFANAFLNNPASMYGHTFLRMRRRGQDREPLLDYTINFAASPDTNNFLAYTLKGLNGSFPGEYSLLPFYMKTQEYSSLESRDLWDYRLRLTQEQVDRLVMHGWEMGSTHFDYYFFTKNCSYQLLTFLEAAVDSLDASSKFRFTVIPGDTVRALVESGLAEPPVFRPSYVTEIKARRRRLSLEELARATALGSGALEADLRGLAALPVERQALVLESAQDYLRYRVGFGSAQEPGTLEAEHRLLRARGRLGVSAASQAPDAPEPLERGHATSRLGLGGGVNRDFIFQEVSWRGALHDLPAAAGGYIPDSQLEMLSVRLRFDDRAREPYLERLDVVDIVALSPWDAWVRQPSWRLSTGVDQAKELGCAGASCMYYDATVGAGLAAESHLARRELSYLLLETDFGAGPVLDRGWWAGGGATAGVLVDALAWWRVSLEATYTGFTRGPARERLRLTSAWPLSRDAELRLTLDKRVPDQEAGLYFFHHF